MTTRLYYDQDYLHKHTQLVFPKEWIGTKLPAPWQHPLFGKPPGTDQTEHFEIELLDTQDGKVYKAKHNAFYEEQFPEDTETTVQIYMFVHHYCPCHRKIDALAAGADTDEECEGERFVVQSVTAPAHMPGLVLYSETLDAKTLTERCLKDAH